DPTVLDDALRAEITSPQVPTGYYDGHHSYGLGMFVWDLWRMEDGSFYPIRVWEHGGNTLSFTSGFLLLPDEDAVVSILSNGEHDASKEPTDAILRAIVDPLPPVSDYRPVVDPSALGPHTGAYYDPVRLGTILIDSDGADGLRVSLPDVEALGYDVAPDL